MVNLAAPTETPMSAPGVMSIVESTGLTSVIV